MKISGVKMCFFNKNNLELITAWFWIHSILFFSFICFFLFIYVTFFTSYYSLSFIYLCWAYYDKETPNKGGYKVSFIRNSTLWKYFIDYFPIILKKTADLDHDKNYLFGYFPHGVLPAGIFGCFGNDKSDWKTLFPKLNVHISTLKMNFHLPVFREYCLALNAISSSKESISYVLDDKKKGNVVILAVGGATESLYATPGPYYLVLKDRTGFVKIALEKGAHLVPVFAFGEINLYKQYNPPGSKLYKLQLFLKKFISFSPLIPFGRGLFIPIGIVPMKSPINVVVGNPIPLPKISNPTDDDVENYHSLFCEELVKLFEDHKDKYEKNAEIVII